MRMAKSITRVPSVAVEPGDRCLSCGVGPVIMVLLPARPSWLMLRRSKNQRWHILVGVPIVREVDMNLIWYCFMGMTAVADLMQSGGGRSSSGGQPSAPWRCGGGGRSVLCGQRALCAMEDKSGAVVLWADVLLWLWNDVDYLGRCQGSSGSQNVHSISTICVNCGNIHEYQSYVAIISGR